MKTKTKAVSPVFTDTKTEAKNDQVKKILLAVAAAVRSDQVKKVLLAIVTVLMLVVLILVVNTYAHAEEQDITCTISQRTAPIFYVVGPRAKVEWPVTVKAKDTDTAISKIMGIVFSTDTKDKGIIFNADAEAAHAEYRKSAVSQYVYPSVLRLLAFGNELHDWSFSVACPFSDDGVVGKIVVDVKARMVIDDWGNK